MNEIAEQQALQRAWINDALQEMELDLTNLAREAKVSPSTLTRFMKEEWGGLLGARTWGKLQKTRKRFASGGSRSVDRNPKVNGDVVQESENALLLAIWGRLDPDIKEAALTLIRTINRVTKKAS